MSIVKTSTLSNIEGTKELAVNDLIDRACCRAWVNFNGTVNPCVVRRSYNVDDVIYLGVGSYRINFTNSIPNYGTVAGLASESGTKLSVFLGAITTSRVDVNIATSGGATGHSNATQITVAVFG